MNANPGLIQPNDVLCQICYQKALQPSVIDDTTVEEQVHEELSSDEPEEQFSQRKLQNLNSVLATLGLPTLEYSRRNTIVKQVMVKKAANDVKDAILKLFNVESHDPKTDLSVVTEDIKFNLQDASRTDRIKIASLFSGTLGYDTISDTFGLSNRAARIAKMLYKSKPPLTDPPRKRGKTLSAHVVEAVRKFYENDEYSRVSPNMKDVTRRKNPDGTEEDVQRRLLLCSITELYSNFRKEHPGNVFKIGRTKFWGLRPSNVQLLKTGHHEVCLCIYHENIRLLYSAVGIRNYKDFIAKLVCDKENKDCMFRKCNNCTLDSKMQQFTDALRSHIIEHYPKYEEMDIPFKEWSQSNRELLISSSLSLDDFVMHVVTKTSHFLRQYFTAHSQAKAFKEMKANVDKTTAIIQCDFAENYSPIYDREVQKAFFVKQQTTIHPFVITLLHEGKPKTISAVVISDEMHHVTNTYYAFQKCILNWLLKEYPKIKHIAYWSDGAGSQYKNFKNVANIKQHYDDFGVHATHHFFASCHGKGSCDAIGGVVKCKARRAAYAGEIIQTPNEFFNFVSANVQGVRSFFVSSDGIEQLVAQMGLEQRYSASQKIAHIREMHKVHPIDNATYFFELSVDTTHCGVLQYEEVFQGNTVEVGDWVAAIYDDAWYYGRIKKVLPDLEELSVQFFRDPGDKNTTFSKFETNATYVPWCRVIMKVSAPSKPTNRSFQFDDHTKNKVIEKLSKMQ